MLARLRQPVTPALYARATRLHLVALTAIVLTGAGVRITGSGLGCPDWPKCYGKTLPPLDSHAVIEYSNRIFSGLVGLTVLLVIVMAARRRPFRRDLLLLGVACMFGVMGQAILGGITVKKELRPGYVMGHFALSMLILVAAVALDWRARHEPGSRPRSSDRLTTWAVRGLVPLGAVAIFVGTASTAAGPHSGGKPGQKIHRLDFYGSDTLDWLIHRHAALAAILGIASLGTWFLVRSRTRSPELRGALTVVVVLLAAQGIVGGVQYETKLPGEIVWVHVMLAAFNWIAILWACAVAGRLTSQAAPVADPLPPAGAEAPQLALESSPVARR